MSAATAYDGPASDLRLTARGRVAVLAVLFAVLFGLLSVGNARSAAVPTDPRIPATRSVVAQPGETLWDIAVDAQPAADPRKTIDQILDLNGLGGPVDLHPGERLAVPAG